MSEIEVVSPIDGAVVAVLTETEPADVQAVVDAARAAFPGWARTPVEQRAAVLDRWAAAVEKAGDEIAAAVHREMGMPIPLAQMMAMPSTVMLSGNCPNTSQPMPEAEMIWA